MDVICVRILLCISFLRYISLSAGVNIVTSTFRVRAKHHDKERIRKCAMKVLQNTNVIGGRISDSTGHCEELTHSLAQNQTFESGYGHVDKINFIKDFQPAIPSGLFIEDFAAMLPLPLSMISKIELTFDRTPPLYFIISFDDCQYRCSTSDISKSIMFWIDEINNTIHCLASPVKEETVAYKWETFCPLSKCKLTFVIHDKGIKVLANDQKITEITSVGMSSLLQGMQRIKIMIGGGVKLSRLDIQS